MIPKEKAKELVDKYLDIDSKYEYLSYSMAKQCALIAVDEILSLCWNGNMVAMEYWQKVKQEIQEI
jgi:hypothetical protein